MLARDLGAVPYALGWRLAQRLPEPVVAAAFEQMADAAWRRHGPGVRRLEANLARAMAHATDRGIPAEATGVRELSRRALRSYLRYWSEVFRLPVWDRDRVVDTFDVPREQFVRDAYAEGRGLILALPHMGNWDHAGAWCCLTGMPLVTVAERLEPARVYRQFVEYRERLGMRVLPLTGGTAPVPTLVDALRAGRLVCLVADRDLSRAGLTVRLLGEPARLPAGPALLARMTGATLLPVTLAYDGPILRGTVHDPVLPRPGRDGLVEMTAEVADAFSAGIARSPRDWHMLQRVFVADVEQRETEVPR